MLNCLFIKMPSKNRAALASSAIFLMASAPPSCHADEASDVGAVLGQYDQSKFDGAKKLCQRLLAEHPQSLTAHYLFGNICVKLNQLNEAEAAYKFCLRGGKDSIEAGYAYTALQQIYEQRRPQPTGTSTLAAPARPTAGFNHTTEEKVAEETARLQQDAKDKIDVKQRTLNDRIVQVQKDIQEQIAASPRGRRAGFFRQEYQAQVRADGQDRLERLKKEFEREKDDINQACQKRIDDLNEYEHNIDARSLRR